ncbi:MAG: oxidoreductase domain protein [Acidobacteria bacterium]|nr:oxidoreductase domain protein [Acidobacteriota bacterium]
MTNEIRVGLIGYGMSGRVFHAPIIQSVPHLKLKTVVQRRADDSRDRYPSVAVVQDAAAVFADPDIDLVVITTPNNSHFDLARKALLANKHVVVEKPFTNTVNEARQLIEIARQQNRIVSAFQNRRWDGDFLTVKQILNGELLGRLVEYESHFDRYRNLRQPTWREEAGPGSGILFDLGSHLIDQAQVLFGLPQLITADISAQRETSQITDNFELILHYDRLKVTLKAGMLVREPGARFTLHGTAGSFVKFGLDPQEGDLKKGLTPSVANWGEESEDDWGKLNTEIGGLNIQGRIKTIAGCYQAYYQNIAAAIAGQAELAVKPEEARNTIRIIELAMQSAEQRRTIPFSLN